MKRGPSKQSFQIVRGGGLAEEREAARLDRFLIDPGNRFLSEPDNTSPIEPDPLLISSLRREEQDLRRRRLGLALTLLLALLTAVPSLSTFLRPSVEPIDTAISPDREKARLLVGQGRELMARNRYNEALESFRLATRLAPGLGEAWTELAGCQMTNYQSSAAERDYLRALALEPKNAEALKGLGNLYLRRGDERKAEIAWLRGGLHQQLARLYLLQGRFPEAEARLASLGRPASGDDLTHRMARAARSRRLEPALRSLLEPEPTGMSAWADLGWRLTRQERYDEATTAFQTAISQVPYDVNALGGLGASLLALNRPREAKVYFERALKLDGDHVRSLNGLAQCLKEEGRVDEAIAMWQGMAELYPGVNDSTPGLAWTYYELGDYSRAAVYFARLIRKYPYDSRVIDALNVAVENLRPAGAY